MNRPRAIGTSAETGVVRYARANGFHLADRIPLSGAQDRGDVTLCPGVIAEVKAGAQAHNPTDRKILEWLTDTEQERVNAEAALGFLICKRKGAGTTNAHVWPTFWSWAQWCRLTGLPAHEHVTSYVTVNLETALILLRLDGWGSPLHQGEATS